MNVRNIRNEIWVISAKRSLSILKSRKHTMQLTSLLSHALEFGTELWTLDEEWTGKDESAELCWSTT